MSKIISTLSLLIASAVMASPLLAATQAQIIAEISGISDDPQILPIRDPNAAAAARGALGTTGVLLIPESTNDRVMAFDPVTGNLIDADFIPADPDNLSTPIQAILSSDGNSILVSDQSDDVVQQYDLDGLYLGIFAPAGGVDVAILDNVRGISLDPTGNLLVSVGDGANADAIAEFNTSGNFLGNRVANGAGGLDSPFDVLVNGSELLIPGVDSDALHRFDLSGTFIADLAVIDNFPEQVHVQTDGNILVANFVGAQEGVIELTSAGAVVGVYNPVSLGGYRGAYALPNGNILTTNGDGVHEIDRAGFLVETKIGGVSARFIEFVQPGPPPVPQVIPSLGVIGLLIMISLLLIVGLWMQRKGSHSH